MQFSEHQFKLQQTQFKPKDTHRSKVKEWKNILHANK